MYYGTLAQVSYDVVHVLPSSVSVYLLTVLHEVDVQSGAQDGHVLGAVHVPVLAIVLK